MTVGGSFARYYGPCDVRIRASVMRLHCYLHPGTGPVSGYVDDRYAVSLTDIARQDVTLCLPGGVTVPVRAGDILLRNGEPIGWPIEQWDPRQRDLDITYFGNGLRRVLAGVDLTERDED